MKKKILVQLFLFSLFLFLSIFFFYEYFVKEPQIIKKTIPDKNLPTKNLETNLITDLRYFSIDDKGNKYEIISEFGEMSAVNSDIILMTSVKAVINIYNSDPITITSNFAKYNVKSYDTEFKENVLVKHVDNKLNGENLDLSFQKHLMVMYNNIIYQNSDTKLLADKLEVDLITKDSKIIMNNKESKIKIIKKK
jgi:lipopolysaccharide export system protein LptA